MPDINKMPSIASTGSEEPATQVKRKYERKEKPEVKAYYPTREQWAEFRQLPYLRSSVVGEDAYATGMNYVDSARKQTFLNFEAYYKSLKSKSPDMTRASLCRMIGVDQAAMHNRIKDGTFVMPFASLSALCTSVMGVSCHEYLFGYKGRVPLPGQLAVILDLMGKNMPARKVNRMNARFESDGKPYKKVDYVTEQMVQLYAEAGKEGALRPEPSIRARDRFGTNSEQYTDDSIAALLIHDRLKELGEARGLNIMRLMDREPVYTPLASSKDKANRSQLLWSNAPTDIKAVLSVFDLTEEDKKDPVVLGNLHPRGIRPLMYMSQRLNVSIDYFLETDYSPFVEMGWEHVDCRGNISWVKAPENHLIQAFVSRYLRMNREYQDKIAAIAMDALMFG